MNQIKVLIYGAGAIGVFFGSRLIQAGHEVTFVDREERVQLILDQGLKIVSKFDGDFEFTPRAISDPLEAGAQDLILIAVKAFHTYDIALKLLPILKPSTIVASLQNGLENERILADLLGQNLVIGAVPSFSGSLQNETTLIQQAEAFLTYGEMDHQPSDRLEWLSGIFAHAGIKHKITDNITFEIWLSFLWNNTFNLVSALTRTTMGQIAGFEMIQQTLEQMMREVQQVAKAEGVNIPDQLLEEIKERSVMLGPIKSNMLKDLEAGQMPELEPLAGTLLKKAMEHGVSIPVNQTVYNLMRLKMLNYPLHEEGE